MREVAELIAAKLAEQGWGRASFDFRLAAEGLIVVHIERSVLAVTAPGSRSPLRGLGADDAERPAGDVLAEIPWEGLPPDPDVATAEEILSLL
jgi:hypothetical protein